MARGQDLLFAHHGSSNEDNATKNLCWLLNHLPWGVSSDLLRPLVGAFGHESLLDELGPEDVEVVAQESAEVTATRSGTKLLLGLAARGHSHSETNISNFNPVKDDTTSVSVPDLTIQLGDEVVIAIEAKDGGFNRRQLIDHARWMNADQFETITWNSIGDQFDSTAQSLSDSDREQKGLNGASLPASSVELLLNEYKNILQDQLIVQNRVIASSGYTTGTNYIEASINVGSDKLSGRVTVDPVQSLPVPVAISFRASGEQTNGQRLWFSREEWTALLKSISVPRYHRQLAQGDLSGIMTDYNHTKDGDITIAHIEDSDGNEKAIFYGTGKGDRTDPLLYMNRSTAAGANLQVPPMYSADEFDSLIANNDQMKRLFTNPESVFDELEKTI